MGALQRKLVVAALKFVGAEAAMHASQLAVAAVKLWNDMLLRGEVDRARADMRRQFTANRELARAIHAKYAKDMSPEVDALFREVASEIR